MKITVKPSDLIKRFIWDEYDYFCLYNKTKSEVEKIIKDDLEFEINENDAFVIGLTRVIFTDEIIYKFKQYLKEILENKCFDYVDRTSVSNDEEDLEDDEIYVAPKLMITKDIIIESAKKFTNKIPKVWDMSKESNKFSEELRNIPILLNEFILKINKLPTYTVNDYTCVKYVSVKKVINKTIK